MTFQRARCANWPSSSGVADSFHVVWPTVVNVASSYGMRPEFIYIACVPVGASPQPPAWGENGCTDTDTSPCDIVPR